MTKLASDISIKIDGDDITDKVLFAETNFTSQANPIQGSYRLAIKDVDQSFSVVNGKKISMHIDGVGMFGGYVKRWGRGVFFPAVDTRVLADVKRKISVTGPDFNAIWDARILRDPDDFASALRVPSGKRTITKAFKHLMDNYISNVPGLDYTSQVDNVTTSYGDDEHGGLYVGQSKALREQMDDFADNGGIIYYIDADFRVHLHEYESARVGWAFSDYPDGSSTIGFREGEYSDDFMEAITKAYVWGGSALARPGQDPAEDEIGIGVVFAEYPDPPAADATWWNQLQSAGREQAAIDRINSFGRWEYAEMNIGQENYLAKGSVKNRAFVIINGPPGVVPTYGIEGGKSVPIRGMTASWFAHDVPNGDHLRPGYLHDFVLYTQGGGPSNPLIVTLPLRSVRISFPTLPSNNPGGEMKTFVRFDGTFGTSHSDSRHLWKALKRRQRRTRRDFTVTVDNYSTGTAPAGAQGSYFPLETPDGVRSNFSFPVTFWTGTTKVYINGLYQRPDIDYSWTSGSQIHFYAEPGTGDNILAYGNVSE